MSDREPCCLACRFFVANKTKKDGTCHRYAPRPDLSHSFVIWGWPRVEFGDWCGEFAPIAK